MKNGFYRIELKGESSVEIIFDLPIRLFGCHPRTNQDTLTVQRGPIIYVVKSFDNSAIEDKYPHFQGVGLSAKAFLGEVPISIGGIEMVGIKTGESDMYAVVIESKGSAHDALYPPLGKYGERSWTLVKKSLTFVPWFARANRDDSRHVRRE